MHRWTAEEGRHGAAIRDYLTVTRAVDPVELERARMVHMETGFESDYGDSMVHGLAYVSFQELATRVSHRNTGTASGDPVCEALMSRIATDENLHMIFYRNVLGATLELEPEHHDAGDHRRREVLPDAGSLDRGLHPQVRCRSPTPASTTCASTRTRCSRRSCGSGRSWDIEGLDAEGEQARDELDAYLDVARDGCPAVRGAQGRS